MIAHHESGTISAVQLANWFLFKAVSEPQLDPAFASSFVVLPEEVKERFRELLCSIKDAGFRWSPFLLATHKKPADPLEYSDQLRQIWALLAEMAGSP
jgi:hypothetical protein